MSAAEDGDGSRKVHGGLILPVVLRPAQVKASVPGLASPKHPHRWVHWWVRM